MYAAIENRKNERLNRLSILVIEEEPVGNIFFGLMHNESGNGLYFVSLSGFRPGTFINIKFDDSSLKSTKVSCRAQVVWSEEIDGDAFYGYGTGAKFC